MAVAAPRRRADRDEHRLGLADARRIGGEFEPALAHIGCDQIGEAGLEDRNLAAIERRDLGRHPCRCRSPGDRNRQSRRRKRARHIRRRSWSRAWQWFPFRSGPARRPARMCLRIRRASPPARLARSAASAKASAVRTAPARAPHRPSRRSAPRRSNSDSLRNLDHEDNSAVTSGAAIKQNSASATPAAASLTSEALSSASAAMTRRARRRPGTRMKLIQAPIEVASAKPDLRQRTPSARS